MASGSLSYAGLPESQGNKLNLSAAESRRSFAQIIDTGTFYFSYLTDRNNDTNRTVNLAFFTGTTAGAFTTEAFAIGQFGTTSYNGQGLIELSPLNNTGNIVRSDEPIAYGTGLTHLVVGKVEFSVDGANDRITLWLNPTEAQLDAGDEGGLDPYLIANFNLNATAGHGITGFRPFTGGAVTGLSASNADFDEFRFGTTFASVIPEPSTAGFMLMAGVGLAVRRRRRD